MLTVLYRSSLLLHGGHAQRRTLLTLGVATPEGKEAGGKLSNGVQAHGQPACWTTSFDRTRSFWC
jgi:hypothetical protein